jgi:hypothetical protein
MSEVTARRENGRRRPKGYADWRPQTKTRILLEQVEDVLREYEDHLPLTVRQIFYRLVAAFDYDKTDRAYDRLGEVLVRARRGRLIPFEWIRDDGVTTCHYEWFSGIESFWNDSVRRAHHYRRDRQAGQDYRIELWCEAAGMLPQLAQVANDYSVPVYSSGGFSSLSAVRAIVDRALERDQPTVLLHVGDYDPSGVAIFESVAADAAAFLAEDRIIMSQQIVSERVGLTADQIDLYDLALAPAKATDSRSGSWEGGTCQLEALAPDDLAELVRDAIESWMDSGKLEAQIEREDDDRQQLLRALPRGES